VTEKWQVKEEGRKDDAREEDPRNKSSLFHGPGSWIWMGYMTLMSPGLGT
jgi:hypothetical protein